METSRGDIAELLKNLAAQKILETGDVHAAAMYDSAQDMLDTINAVPYGDVAWTTFQLKYNGPITPHTPAWKLQTYTIHTRNALRVAESIAGSSDFEGHWDYIPYEEYTGPGCRRFSDVMSGTWAYKKAVSYSLRCPRVCRPGNQLSHTTPDLLCSLDNQRGLRAHRFLIDDVALRV